MWNDTDIPLAIFFTFRTYGTWLHGDERGSVDRHNNAYGSPRIPHIGHFEAISRDRMKHAPVLLDGRRRHATELGIREVCEKRGWKLYAINVRTNHGHVVAAIGSYSPERALSAMKAYATRRMREDKCWVEGHSPWAEKGSKRRLWNEKHILDAVEYVVNGQGSELPRFD